MNYQSPPASALTVAEEARELGQRDPDRWWWNLGMAKREDYVTAVREDAEQQIGRER